MREKEGWKRERESVRGLSGIIFEGEEYTRIRESGSTTTWRKLGEKEAV